MREALCVESAPHRPRSVVVDIGCEVRSNRSMMAMQAKPKWSKQLKAALSPMFDSQIQSPWILRAFELILTLITNIRIKAAAPYTWTLLRDWNRNGGISTNPMSLYIATAIGMSGAMVLRHIFLYPILIAPASQRIRLPHSYGLRVAVILLAAHTWQTCQLVLEAPKAKPLPK